MLKTITDTVELFAKSAVERDEWDEMPMLFVETEEQGYLLALAVEGSPYDALKGVTLAALKGEFPFKPADVTGLLLTTEGWGLSSAKVSGNNPDPKVAGEILMAHAAELQAQGKGHADSPYAIEVKNYIAVDADSVYYAVLNRGETELNRISEDAAEIGGGLLDALRATFELFHREESK